MKRIVRKVVAMGLVFALIFGLTACKKSQSLDKVVMTYVTAPLNVPSVLDKEKGYFKEAYEKMGTGLEYSDITSGAEQTLALASGDIQILNAVGTSSVLLAAANGADIAIISMYSAAPKAFAMFSKDESINSPKDLNGLTIGGPKGTNLHELLVSYLASGEMTVDDINFVNMDIPSAIAALDGGSIDVALVGGSAAYNMEKSGVHMITDGEGYTSATIVTATSREFAKEHPEIIETFKKTQKDIADFMKNNEDDTIKITAKSLDMDETAVRDMYKLYDFNTEITAEDIALMESTEKFLYENGMMDKEVDVKSLILN